MTTATNQNRYSLVAIGFHWLIFGLLVWQVAIGWSMEDLKGAAKIAPMQLHKSMGFTILLLSIARLGWRIKNLGPPPPPNMKDWELKLLKITHLAFYALLIGIPFLGWVLISTSSYRFPTLFWGMFEWPTLPLQDLNFTKPLHEAAEFGHSKFVWLGILLMILHVAAAIKHQFIDKDGVLARMLPFLK
ncbi:MAG: YceI/cytochrome b561 periplasmic protein [Hyphomonadaceae bacterium]|nr:MAG: YceI/cytochrome b561 periplasmic protein [Hyphomonadaceae bacterium]